MKGGEFHTQRTFSSKDKQTFELRKVKRKNIGDNILSKIPSKEGKPLSNRDASFLHRHKGSEGGLGIFRTPISSKNPEKKGSDTMNTISLEKNLSGHRRTKTLNINDQKKSSLGLTDHFDNTHTGHLNSNINYGNSPNISQPKKIHEKNLAASSKENAFHIDLKNVKQPSSSRNKRSA